MLNEENLGESVSEITPPPPKKGREKKSKAAAGTEGTAPLESQSVTDDRVGASGDPAGVSAQPGEGRRAPAKRKRKIVGLTKVETRTLSIDQALFYKAQEKAKKVSEDLEASDTLSSIVYDLPKKIKFKVHKRGVIENEWTLPKSAWDTIDEWAKLNNATIEETIEEILKR